MTSSFIPVSATNAPPDITFAWYPMREEPSKFSHSGFKQISVATCSDIWALDETGGVYVWCNGNDWVQLVTPPDVAFSQLSMSSNGHRVALDSAGNVWLCSGEDYTWSKLDDKAKATLSSSIEYISVGELSEDIYVSTKDYKTYKWSGSAWEDINKILKNASVGVDGDLWGVQFYKKENARGLFTKTWHFNTSSNAWEEYAPLANLSMFIKVGSANHVIVQDRQGDLWIVPNSKDIPPIKLVISQSPKVSIDSFSVGSDGTIAAIINRNAYALIIQDSSNNSSKISPQGLNLLGVLGIGVLVMIGVQVYYLSRQKELSKHLPIPSTPPTSQPPISPTPSINFDIYPNIFCINYDTPTEDKNIWRFKVTTPKLVNESTSLPAYVDYKITDITKTLVKDAKLQGYNAIMTVYNEELWKYCKEIGIKYFVDLSNLIKLPDPKVWNNDGQFKRVLDVVQGKEKEVPYVGYALFHEITSQKTKKKDSPKNKEENVNTIEDICPFLEHFYQTYPNAKVYLCTRDEGWSKLVEKSSQGSKTLNNSILSVQEFHTGLAPQTTVNILNKFKKLDLNPLSSPRLCQMLLYDFDTQKVFEPKYEKDIDEYTFRKVFRYLLNSRLALGYRGSFMLAAHRFFDLSLFEPSQNAQESRKRINWEKYKEVKWDTSKLGGLKNAFDELSKMQFILAELDSWKCFWSTKIRYKILEKVERTNIQIAPNGCTFLKDQRVSVDKGDLYLGQYGDKIGNTLYMLVNPYTWKSWDADEEIKITINNNNKYGARGEARKIKVQLAQKSTNYQWNDGKIINSDDSGSINFALEEAGAAFIKIVEVS